MRIASNFAYISKKNINLFKSERARIILKKQLYAEDQEDRKKCLESQLQIIEEQSKVFLRETSGEELDSDDLNEDLQNSKLLYIRKPNTANLINQQHISLISDDGQPQIQERKAKFHTYQAKYNGYFGIKSSELEHHNQNTINSNVLPEERKLEPNQQKLMKLEQIRNSELQQYNSKKLLNPVQEDQQTIQQKIGKFYMSVFQKNKVPDQSCQSAFSSQQKLTLPNLKVKKSNQKSDIPKKYKEKVDSNIIHLNLQTIKDMKNLKNGKPTYCDQCKAAINSYCEISKDVNNFSWKCAFFNKINASIIGDQVQQNMITTYCNDSQSIEEVIGIADQDEDITIIFCIDISGSMGSFCHNINKTRLEAIKSALIKQISEMAHQFPKRKVGLVTFSGDVKILGNFQSDTITINREDLNNPQILIKQGIQSYQVLMNKSLASSQKDLIKVIQSMKPTKHTALGPGLLSSIALASQGKKGSQVLLCTDGVSTLGLGNLTDDYDEALNFYLRVAKFATKNDVTTHIVTFNSEECGIGALLPVVEQTGGTIERVSGDNLSDSFKEIISRPIIATKAKIRLHLKECFKFNREEKRNLRNEDSTYYKIMGNTELTFEFGLKPINRLAQLENISIDKLKKVPFQLQIQYTGLDGKNYIKIITNAVSISNDRKLVETQADVDLLALNSIQQSSKLARKGDYKKAQILAKASYNSIVKTVNQTHEYKKLSRYQSQLTPVYNIIKNLSKVTPKMSDLSLLSRTNDHNSQYLYQASKLNSSSYMYNIKPRNL
ncbi:type a von willebrand factor domain-containing protein [Stylonychia lemnae]|uniref:Type a von willebrand factor domain-containing protein n=1 Tax=Stylonychia lemnae TaxID=5949 RepID=A0A078B487_STYLE|nr:type a von willebrand factor domain-containing protein [Stylonychia lemnae]|eukprot:CDW89289.1 type a von willebrand factor domain-containing protein [Stylonychia lemnae]